jgi:hypothetical protein
MQDDPIVTRMKAEMLAAVNEFRVAVDKTPLDAFPEQFCLFCGSPRADVGALYRSAFAPFIHICRICTGKAQRSFVTRGMDQPEDRHDT